MSKIIVTLNQTNETWGTAASETYYCIIIFANNHQHSHTTLPYNSMITPQSVHKN